MRTCPSSSSPRTATRRPWPTPLRAGASDYLPKARLTEDSLASAIRHEQAAHVGERARRAAEAALLASEERYHGLFTRSLGGMFRLAADGRVLDCNPASARILGYATSEDVQAHNALEFFADPVDAARLIERIRHERNSPSGVRTASPSPC